MSSKTGSESRSATARNVFGEALHLCCSTPITGYYRDGFCHTGPTDFGVHTVCAVVTNEFLEFSKSQGNDLMRSAPEYGFPGLKEGDRWCLCVSRWKEAFDVGKAPGVVLAATHEQALKTVTMEQLNMHAVEL